MDEGALVPDEVTNGIVEERLQKKIVRTVFCWMDFQEQFLKRKHYKRLQQN